MEIYRIIKPVKNIINKSGEEVANVFDIQAVPLNNSTNAVRAIQTYESVSNLDAGNKIKPEYGTCFLGEVVHNRLYIIKFIDNVPPAVAEISKASPKYKAIAQTNEPGELVFKTPAQSSFSLLRNGVMKFISSMGSFFYLEPYIPGGGVPQLLDKMFLTLKNFILNIYGGRVTWSNFKEDEKWKSELALDVYRGDAISRDKEDRVLIRLGSPSESKDSIITLDIKHKSDDGKVSTHTVEIGKNIKIDSEYVGDKTTTHSIDVGNGVSITSKFEEQYEHTIELKKDIRIQTKSDESKVYVGTSNETSQPLATEHFVKKIYNQHKHIESGAITGPPIPLAIIIPKDSKNSPLTFTTKAD